MIDAGEEQNLAVSHGVFLAHDGILWAFHGAYYNKMESIHTRAYTLDEESGEWHAATEKIDGKTVFVTSAKVKSPIAVRYACEISPTNCNFYNRAGLPAAPFCSRPDLLQYDPKLPD